MAESTKIRKSRASSSDQARQYRQQGYDDALEFALLIGLKRDYQNNPQAKKDVIDASGDAHSVKGGVKKWQVFLYRASRFGKDDAFVVMNGIGKLLGECIESFPPNFNGYKQNKIAAKERLRKPMVELAEKLKDKGRLRAFLGKALFNGNEVNYLTVKHKDAFHVFLNTDVVQAFADNLEVCNSTARRSGEMPEQKVLLRYKGLNLGELEMRNDSLVHYREVRFNMIKAKVMDLLLEKIPVSNQYNDKVFVHGSASKVFGRWGKD